MDKLATDSSLLRKLPINRALDFLINLRAAATLKVAADVVLIFTAACWTWLVSFSQVRNLHSPVPFLTVVIGVRLAVYAAMRLDHLSWRTVSRFEVFRLALSAVAGALLTGLAFYILPPPYSLKGLSRPIMLVVTEPMLYLTLLCGARITVRAIYYRRSGHRRVLIVGAGDAGRAISFQIQESQSVYDVVGFVDDADYKQGRRYRGVPVLGVIDDLARIAVETKATEVVIAIPSMSPDGLRHVLKASEPCGLPVRTLPPLTQLLGGRADLATIREVRMEDLLPRPEVDLDRAKLAGYLAGRTVMVTGGGGSIGGELCRQVRAAGAAKLLVLGRGENSVFEMTQELAEIAGTCEILPVICDVRDRAALDKVFQKHDISVIFHAAAHKHVPLMESYPCEAIKNNVVGTLNVVELAIQYRVAQFVMVSTDKAVEPTNVMGASKRICELIVKGFAARHQANMVCVRFGNVLGSRGSVVLTMTKQIQRGKPVTVTDPDMVRYFMTIPEAVQLILQAGSIGGCGEIFVLDMGRPVKILDLAHDLIRLHGLMPNHDIPIRIIGRRPGEKIKEDILSHSESRKAEKSGPFYMAPAQAVQLQLLLQQISTLRAASDAGDNAKVVGLIKEVVPEFIPDANHWPPPRAIVQQPEPREKPMRETALPVPS